MSFGNAMNMEFASVTSPQLEQAQTLLKHSERTFSQTQNELQSLISYRSQTPMSVADSINKDREIHELQNKLLQQHKEMEDLKKTIEQQKVTIMTQSRTISQPKQPYVTPGRGFAPQQASNFPEQQQNYPQPPLPIVNTSPPTHQGSGFQPLSNGHPIQTHHDLPPHHGQQQGNHYASQVHRSGSSAGGPGPAQADCAHFGQNSSIVDPFGSPEPRGHNRTPGFQHSSNPSSHGSGGKHTSGQMLGVALRGAHAMNSNEQSRASSTDNSRALVKVQESESSKDMSKAFGQLIHMIQLYAFNHVNTPSTHKDNGMPQAVKDRLLKAASTTTAFQLMSTPYTRYYLVTKVIVQWLMKNVLKHDSFRGFVIDIDQRIESLRASIYQTTPAQVRFQILTNIAQQMRTLQGHPNFEQYLQHISRQRSNELWSIIKPMMHMKTTRDWDDLLSLVVDAHKVTIQMFSETEEYRFEIPPFGTLFTAANMVARDPHNATKDGQQLEREHATVRLGISPHITARQSTAEGLVRSVMVLPATVLVKVGH